MMPVCHAGSSCIRPCRPEGERVMVTRRWTSRLAWTVVIVLAVIGLAAVTRRVLDLAQVIPPTPASMRGGAFDAGFAPHPLLTLAHIVPGALFMVLGPLQLGRRIRARHL